MIALFVCVLLIGALIVFHNFCKKPIIYKEFNFKENAVIKKFNKLLKQITADNITVIKNELLKTLEEYRAIKKAQFVDNRTNLVEALDAVNVQYTVIYRTTNEKESEIHTVKGKIPEEQGARLMYELELHKDTLNKLNASREALNNKIALLDGQMIKFDSDLALRKAKIVSMIADAISIEDRSYIDLRLDSLEQEFKHEANKNAQKKIVDEKMGDSVSTTKLEFDLEKYKKLYKEF